MDIISELIFPGFIQSSHNIDHISFHLVGTQHLNFLIEFTVFSLIEGHAFYGDRVRKSPSEGMRRAQFISVKSMPFY